MANRVRLFRIINTIQTRNGEIYAQDSLQELYAEGRHRFPCELEHTENGIDVFIRLAENELLKIGCVSVKRQYEFEQVMEEHSPRLAVVVRNKKGFCLPSIQASWKEQ